MFSCSQVFQGFPSTKTSVSLGFPERDNRNPWKNPRKALKTNPNQLDLVSLGASIFPPNHLMSSLVSGVKIRELLVHFFVGGVKTHKGQGRGSQRFSRFFLKVGFLDVKSR